MEPTPTRPGRRPRPPEPRPAAVSYLQLPLRRPSALLQMQVVPSTEGAAQSKASWIVPSSLREADLSGGNVSTAASGSFRQSKHSRSEALLARPDVVQLPEDVYIPHTCTCHPRRCSTGVNDILKWQWAHRETTADRCWSICLPLPPSRAD